MFFFKISFMSVAATENIPSGVILNLIRKKTLRKHIMEMTANTRDEPSPALLGTCAMLKRKPLFSSEVDHVNRDERFCFAHTSWYN